MVVKETKKCAGFDDTNHYYSTPSVIPSGQLLKKVGELNMAHSLETVMLSPQMYQAFKAIFEIV